MAMTMVLESASAEVIEGGRWRAITGWCARVRAAGGGGDLSRVEAAVAGYSRLFLGEVVGRNDGRK